MSKYRKRTRNSKKLFTATADRTHSFNLVYTTVPRGGIRL